MATTAATALMMNMDTRSHAGTALTAHMDQKTPTAAVTAHIPRAVSFKRCSITRTEFDRRRSPKI